MKSVFCSASRKLSSANLLFLLSALCPLHVPKAFAGDLNPPPGPIGPTMKPLADVEPRIAINATNTPGDAGSLFRITEPGAYYLTSNINGVSGKAGIRIATGGVSLDLMGFQLTGVPGSLDGIDASATGGSMVIRNGTIASWGGAGLRGGGQAAQYHNLQLSFNDGSGLTMGSSNTVALVTHCIARFNDGDGIEASNSAVIKDCAAVNNGHVGILAGSGSTISNCSAANNSGDGITTGSGSVVTVCTSEQSEGGVGFTIGSGSTIAGCTSASNFRYGIFAGDEVTITGCTVTGNSVDGIGFGARCRVTENLASNNGRGGVGSGIVTSSSNSRIENNTVSGNKVGIGVLGSVTGNIVVRNHATFNANGNYVHPASGNFIGTIITGSAAMNAAANDLVNISFSGQ